LHHPVVSREWDGRSVEISSGDSSDLRGSKFSQPNVGNVNPGGLGGSPPTF
jgi:hypothetical protein